MDYSKRWDFVADMDYSDAVTITDVWLWFKWIFFYPGDFIIAFTVQETPKVARFLELSYADFGGVLSGVISFIIWVIVFKALFD